MLIQQIIKKQTISILDKILQEEKERENKKDDFAKNEQKQFTVDDFVTYYLEKGVIKHNDKEVLVILIRKHLESIDQCEEGDGKLQKFTLLKAIAFLNQIKLSIIEQRPTSPTTSKLQTNTIQLNQQLIPLTKSKTLQNVQITPQSIKNHQSISQLSKKVKNQFIMRNIDRIKKYATQVNQTVVEYERTQLQQIKISHEISHKLFDIYRTVFPSGMGSGGKDVVNFDAKQQYKTTLNYHKILEMLNEASIKLEIEGKLSLLRLIKKFSFNQNLITLQEWTKIYRAIINNLAVKEVTLQRLVKQKQEERKSSKFIMPNQGQRKLQNNSIKKTAQNQYRTRRIKTESSIPQSRFVSMSNIITEAAQPQSLTKIDYATNKSGIRLIEPLQKVQAYRTYNPNEYRTKHKKLLKDVNEVMLKNLKKDLRAEKMIGIQHDKGNNSIKEVDDQEGSNEHSYLRKAIKAKKISKITWQTLFDMTQQTMHHNIVIPEFAKDLGDD